MTRMMIRPNRLAQEIDQFFNGCFQAPQQWEATTADFVPRVNINEKDDHIALTFELPGMDKDDIKVTLKDSVLTISGERKVENDYSDDQTIRTEIRTGSFSRSFTLPKTIDSAKVDAKYKNGILKLTLAKKEESLPKEIDVRIS